MSLAALYHSQVQWVLAQGCWEVLGKGKVKWQLDGTARQFDVHFLRPPLSVTWAFLNQCTFEETIVRWIWQLSPLSGSTGAADFGGPGNRASRRSNRHSGSGRSSSAGTQGNVHWGDPTESTHEREVQVEVSIGFAIVLKILRPGIVPKLMLA